MTVIVSACGTAEQFRASDAVDGPLLSKIQIERLAFASLSGTVCDTELTPVCTIDMSLAIVGTERYCVASAPKVRTKPTTGPGQQKRVVWQLRPNSLNGRPLEFHDGAGIVVAHQTHPGHVLHGGRGAGSGNTDTDKYNMNVQRNKPLGAASSYLPVVIWGPAGAEELCAAVDPKIVNEN